MGVSYFVGNSREDAVKLDLFYTDDFIGNMTIEDDIRLASIEDIIAMKLDVVVRGGRKKDFWDLHELSKTYSPMKIVMNDATPTDIVVTKCCKASPTM